MLRQMLNSVVLMTQYSQCAGRMHYLLFGFLARKLLASHGMHSLHNKHQFIRHDEGVRE